MLHLVNLIKEMWCIHPKHLSDVEQQHPEAQGKIDGNTQEQRKRRPNYDVVPFCCLQNSLQGRDHTHVTRGEGRMDLHVCMFNDARTCSCSEKRRS